MNEDTMDVVAARLAESAPALTDEQTLTVLAALRKTRPAEQRPVTARPAPTRRAA